MELAIFWRPIVVNVSSASFTTRWVNDKNCYITSKHNIKFWLNENHCDLVWCDKYKCILFRSIIVKLDTGKWIWRGRGGGIRWRHFVAMVHLKAQLWLVYWIMTPHPASNLWSQHLYDFLGILYCPLFSLIIHVLYNLSTKLRYIYAFYNRIPKWHH